MYSQVAIQIPPFFEQLNQFILTNDHDTSRLTQFKNEAKKYAQSDNVDGYLALGTLACLEGNIDALQTHYQHAIAESAAQHAYILRLYTQCLTPFGFFSQAADLMYQAYHFYPVLNYLDDTIHFYALAGHFHQVVELLKTWHQVSPDKAHRFSQLAEEVMTFMDERKVSDADLERLIEIALSILRQHKLSINVPQINLSLLEDEESLWFHYGIPLRESVEVAKIVELDFELANRSVDECPPQIIQGGFVPMFEVVGEE
ncbi:MAG TPA: hypothetical protein EYP59_04840 [Thiotrichaceae bacterium]|nr:hypothetical protein [Thiotrichaceae bacterium]